MENKHEHSSLKILNNLGKTTESDRGVAVLAEFIKDNNDTVGEMLDQIKKLTEYFEQNKFKIEVEKSLRENNDLIVLKIKERTTEIKTDIISSISKELNEVKNSIILKINEIKDSIISKIKESNKYLIFKIGILSAVISFIISYVFSRYNTTLILELKKVVENLK